MGQRSGIFLPPSSWSTYASFKAFSISKKKVKRISNTLWEFILKFLTIIITSSVLMRVPSWFWSEFPAGFDQSSQLVLSKFPLVVAFTLSFAEFAKVCTHHFAYSDLIVDSFFYVNNYHIWSLTNKCPETPRNYQLVIEIRCTKSVQEQSRMDRGRPLRSVAPALTSLSGFSLSEKTTPLSFCGGESLARSY